MNPTPSSPESIAARIVAAIEADFTDRRGLRQQWEQIDGDIQEEIRREWRALALEELLS